MKTRVIISVLFLAFFVGSSYSEANQELPAKGYYRIVVLADLHLPWSPFNGNSLANSEKVLNQKNKLLSDINSWSDVDRVVFAGDSVATSGTLEEYSFAKNYAARFKAPVTVIAGNHEYLYKDVGSDAKLHRSAAHEQRQKLQRFVDTFGMEGFRSSFTISAWHLVFLSCDKIETKFSVELSSEGLSWFAKDLRDNKSLKTIVFFHAPLSGTLLDTDKSASKENSFAQPDNLLSGLLLENPQVAIWVSGHTHTRFDSPSFDNKVNLWKGKILDLQNDTVDRTHAYHSRSIYLYKDHAQIRTWDHSKEEWVTKLDHTIN